MIVELIGGPVDGGITMLSDHHAMGDSVRVPRPILVRAEYRPESPDRTDIAEITYKITDMKRTTMAEWLLLEAFGSVGAAKKAGFTVTNEQMHTRTRIDAKAQFNA